ncbi:MAG: helix-turn-helix transcriptional regulator [Anaerolineales bacterium]
MKRSDRLELIEQILLDHPHGLRVIQLSERCKVDRRTIYRDLEVLQEMGVPLWQSNGRYGIERDQYLASLRINLNEAFTLLWGIRLLSHHLGHHTPHADSLVTKLKRAFPLELSRQIDAIHTTSPIISAQDRFIVVIENLMRGWADMQKVMIWYRGASAQKVQRLVICPYLLDTTPQAIPYVIALDESSNEIRIYSADRISRAEVLEEETFQRPPEFQPRHYLSLVREMEDHHYPDVVVVRLDAKTTEALQEHKLPLGQRLETFREGSLFIAEVSDWRDMEQIVRSWGAGAEVLAPLEFRNRIAAEYRQAARLYG